MTSTMSRMGMSVTCGPCQLPQHRWKRIRSAGSPRSAWLSASTRIIENFRYASTEGAGLIMSQFSAMDGSSSCSTSPASTMALYSSRIASAHAWMNSSSVL
jgi:hypothetical protein